MDTTEIQEVEPTKGFIFACTDKTEKECFDRLLFSTNKLYADKALQVKKGDTLFLLNLDSDTLYGIFRAKSDGAKEIVSEAWGGKYPYQVQVEKHGEIRSIKKATSVLDRMKIDWKDILNKGKTNQLTHYFENPNELLTVIETEEEEKPPLFATTLWDYPKQSYGKTPKGDNRYPGVTPAFIIYNMIKRYTEPHDLVLDPMAGSGTTLDVCKAEGRRCIAYDIAPTRSDIIQNDARKIPLPDDSIDMVFIDSPYGNNIKYNDNPNNIGSISAESEQFYDELEKVMKECCRVLKPGKVLGWLIGDQWVRKKFTPVGFKVWERLGKYFDTVDVICVVRRNQASNTSVWYSRAIRFNFYLRGFKYLFIMRKPSPEYSPPADRKVTWAQYPKKWQ